MRIVVRKYWEKVTSSYWFIPALMALGAVGLSVVGIWADLAVGPGWIEELPWLYANTPAGARAVLSTIAGSMITVAGVTFSITIAAVSYATAQFGPRLLGNFMRDRGNQVTLGTFIATFLYCLLVLRTVHGDAEGPEGAEAAAPFFVPHIAILLALGMALASLGVLIYFIHHVPESFYMPNVVASIGRGLHKTIEREIPLATGPPAPEAPPPELPERFYVEARPVVATGTGYLQHVDYEQLLQLAVAHDLVVRVEYHPGDFVSRGKALALAWPGTRLSEELGHRLARNFAWGRQRSPTQDVLFQAEELVEIAARALSPGVNDAFTAMTCMDWLGSTLQHVSRRGRATPHRCDEAGRLRLVSLAVTFEGFAAAVLDRLRPYAEKDRNAALHLMKMIAEVAEVAPRAEDRIALVRHAAVLRESCLPALSKAEDRREVELRYRAIVHLAHLDGFHPELLDRHPWLGGSA